MGQRLIMPFQYTHIESGALNSQYYQHWGYQHYGWDLSGKIRGQEEDVYASGKGKVLAAGLDKKFGYVAVIRYYDVYNNKTKQVSDIIARYLHMSKLYVQKEDVINTSSRIGVMSGWGRTPTSYGIHLHIEFANNLSTPCKSGQCSSSNIIKSGSKTTMINPNQILNVGPNQEFVKFNGSWCTNEDMSIPRITNTVIESDTSTTPKYTNSMNKYSQKLILPVNNSLLVEDYSESHFGHEVKSTSNSKIVYASGKGKVIISGKDSLLGNVVIIKYNDVYDIKTNSYIDIIIRYYHLASVNVVKGRAVTKDTKIGIIGNTGNINDIRLCYEVDTDTKYPQYSPSIKKNSSIIKKGINSTINPSRVLFVKKSAPDNQSMQYSINIANKNYKEI